MRRKPRRPEAAAKRRQLLQALELPHRRNEGTGGLRPGLELAGGIRSGPFAAIAGHTGSGPRGSSSKRNGLRGCRYPTERGRTRRGTGARLKKTAAKEGGRPGRVFLKAHHGGGLGAAQTPV